MKLIKSMLFEVYREILMITPFLTFAAFMSIMTACMVFVVVIMLMGLTHITFWDIHDWCLMFWLVISILAYGQIRMEAQAKDKATKNNNP